MSVVAALFVVALLITVTGFFLSPKAQERNSSRTSTLSTRRVAKPAQAPARTASAPVRPRRTAYTDASSLYDAPIKRRASAYVGETAYPEVVSTQRMRAATNEARPTAQRIQAVTSGRLAGSTNVRRPANARTNGAAKAVAYPGPLKTLEGRLLSWPVGIPGLFMIFLLFFYLLNLALPHPLIASSSFFGSTNLPPTPTASSGAPTTNASQRLVRLGQLDPAQYQSMQQYNTWAYSACSAAAMTEVINAYGHAYHITNILTVEANIHEITPELGLLEESGIQHTGEQFGFKTSWGHNLSLDQVIAVANSGTPVIVSFPPAKFPGGHILVVRGGDSSSVDLADSSRLNWTQLSRERFLQLWGGFSAIMKPA